MNVRSGKNGLSSEWTNLTAVLLANVKMCAEIGWGGGAVESAFLLVFNLSAL